MLRDTFTLEDGSAEGIRVYVEYEIEREEREDGRVRIPESVYVDKIRVGGWDGYDISGLLHQYDAYDPICEQIEDVLRKEGSIC